MPNDLVRFPVMCDSVNASAEAVSRHNVLYAAGVHHLERLVVEEEVRRLLLAILHGHRIVKVKILDIGGFDYYDLGA